MQVARNNAHRALLFLSICVSVGTSFHAVVCVCVCVFTAAVVASTTEKKNVQVKKMTFFLIEAQSIRICVERVYIKGKRRKKKKEETYEQPRRERKKKKKERSVSDA